MAEGFGLKAFFLDQLLTEVFNRLCILGAQRRNALLKSFQRIDTQCLCLPLALFNLFVGLLGQHFQAAALVAKLSMASLKLLKLRMGATGCCSSR